MRITRDLPAIALLAVLWLLTASAYGLPSLDIPTVPHPTDGREDCLSCHDAGQLKPFPEDHVGRASESCMLCHSVETGEAPGTDQDIPRTPHSTEGRDDCLSCHGTEGTKPFSEDHADRALETCLLCHLEEDAEAESPAKETGTTHSVPHPLEGRDDCLACHEAGGLKPFPEDHADRANDTCLACHGMGAGQAAEETDTVPSVPHPTDGRENCLACHDTGGLKPFPEDHEGRSSATCLSCHQAESAEATKADESAGEIPSVPHPTGGREDCLACHDTDQFRPFPTDHKGRASTTCLGCHQSDVAEESPSAPHSGEDREDCLVCHNIGMLRPFPTDHSGRNNAHCVLCHELGPAEPPTPTPTPTPSLPASVGVIPTPIHEPTMFEENSCIACHQELGGKHAHITLNWSQSIHAERGVGCVSCHGGDPTQPEAMASMSSEAGYLGPLPKKDIPNLCGSCHARVELMRPYDLSTDQLSQYWQSLHGQALLEGDPNVATCFDCHGGHRTLKISDPASEVYPSKEPGMCGRCHADEELMAPYGIPTNQYELYQESVHGVAMLQNQDLRAPTCSTCHGTHGAAPPGFQEVANVCGQCHATTEDYYLQGAHRTGMTGEAAPRCVTCHGHYDVMPATRALMLGMENPQEQSCGTCHAPGKEERHCGSCHAPGTEVGSQVEAMFQAMEEASAVYEEAEGVIAQAAEQRLLMAAQEELLQRAKTPLIELRALQHNVRLGEIQAKAEESMGLSRQAQVSAEEALQEIDTRRLGMVIALGVILIAIVALILIKRELDRDLEAKRARLKDNLPQENV